MMAAHGQGQGPQQLPLRYPPAGLVTPAFANTSLPHAAPQPPQPHPHQSQPLAFLEPRVSSILVNPYAGAAFPPAPVPSAPAEDQGDWSAGAWRRPPPRAIDTRYSPVFGRQRPHSAAAAAQSVPHSAPASSERHAHSAFLRRASAASTTKRRYAHGESATRRD